ncbi:hypothetical protein BGZ76_011729 [Entomortierella beljakovae]|nr:hypothetical protein BGZ76_011729 [Entomortierella beljakovae]
MNSPQSRSNIEPIVYQYTLYYPGNIPLVITAGHGGSTIPGKQTSRKMTHRFKRVSDIATTSSIIDISTFSEPISSNNDSNISGGTEDTIPWMPLRDQTKGGNFKADLNTHSMALNIANAISNLTSYEFAGSSNKRLEDNGISIEENMHKNGAVTQEDGGSSGGCKAQGEDPEFLFPQVYTSSTSPPSSSPLPTTSSRSKSRPRSIPNPIHNADGSLTLPSRIINRPLNFKQLCHFPHVVVFRVPRKYVDVNRNITGENAIADHPASEAAWREYHDLIDHIQKMVLQNRQQEQPQQQLKQDVKLQGVKSQSVKSQGVKSRQSETINQQHRSFTSAALLLDVHGHAHSTNLIEVGYLLNDSILSLDDNQLNANASALAKESSVRALMSRVVQLDSPSPTFKKSKEKENDKDDDKTKIPIATLLRGRNDSLGGLFQAQGLNAIPSPGNKAPCGGCIYFFGGYTIQRHGSRDQYIINTSSQSSPLSLPSSSFDAIQLELPRTLRLIDKEEGREVGVKIGRAVVEFMAKYYGVFQETVDFSPAFTNNPMSSQNTLLSPSSTATATATAIKPISQPSLERKDMGLEPLLQSNKNERMPPHHHQHRRHIRSQNQCQNQYQKLNLDQNHSHSGDSDTEDGGMDDSNQQSVRRHLEVNRKSSRL